MNESNDIPLIDAIDHDILMHRDAHFGGQFSIMLDYYRRHGKGVNPEFSLSRIEDLAAFELNTHQNLAAICLEAAEIEKVAEARQAYKDLSGIYEVKNAKSIIPQLVADLILTEEAEAEGEVAALAIHKEAAVPALINLLREEKWHDPLFPGYGLVPELAAKCLGLIGDKRAIISLFEAIGQGDFFDDEEILRALKQIGAPAKAFLLKVVKGKPYNEDNERAAIALVAFRDDADVGAACVPLLKDQQVQQDPVLFSYLVLACEGMKERSLQAEFTELAEKASLPRDLREDMQRIIKSWL